MKNISGVIHHAFTIGESGPGLFGGFLEHMGRVIYGGVYEPGHPAADEEGFRKDVLSLVRELGMPLMRYPGGNFASAYDWRTGVGPKTERKKHYDPVWDAVEPNEFALDEFMRWCVKAETEPVLTVNLGTGDAAGARELFDYCRGSGSWGLKRPGQPYPVRYWCLGNEMASPRQPGHKPAAEYADLAAQIAREFKEKDPGVMTILSGSSCRNSATFGYWDTEILERCFDWTDFLSFHAYFGIRENDIPRFLASDLQLDHHIEEVCALCDAVSARRKSSKKIKLSLDEWNVWSGTNRPFKTLKVSDFEDIYSALDAVVFGGLLMSMLDHADRLKIACLAQTCNVLAPIMTRTGGWAWRQTIFYPFALTSRYGRGTVLKTVLNGENLRLTGIWRKKEKELVLFILNRDLCDSAELRLNCDGWNLTELRQAVFIDAAEPDLVNTEGAERVFPKILDTLSLNNNLMTGTIAPCSWNMIRITAHESSN